MKYVTKSEYQIFTTVFALVGFVLLFLLCIVGGYILDVELPLLDEVADTLGRLIVGTFYVLLGTMVGTAMLTCSNTASIQHDIAKLSEQIITIQETLEIE